MTFEQFLLAASYDLQVHVIDLNSCSACDSFEIPNSQANRLVSSGNRFYAAAYTYLLAYDASGRSKKPLQAIAAHDSNVTDLVVSPNTIYTCGEDKLIKCWDRRVAKSQESLGANVSVNALSMTRNSFALVSGNENGDVCLWDLRSTNCVQKLNERKAPVRSISAAPDLSLFNVAYMDAELVRIEYVDGELAVRYSVNAQNEILLRCQNSPDGKMVAACGANNTIKIWDAENGDSLFELHDQETKEWVWDIAFTNDSQYIVAGASDGSCKVWSCQNGDVFSNPTQLEKCVSAITLI